MDIILYTVSGLIILSFLIFGVLKLVKILKLPKEERKNVLITYLKGVVALAEREIGSGNGKEKLAMVEEQFEKKAPFVYKIILSLTGKEQLVDLIEQALKEIKEDFEQR